MQERKRKGTNWGSAIGWVIFLLAVAGGPIFRGLQGLIGNSVQITNLLPYIVGGLVLLSFAVSAVRALSNRQPDSASPSLPDTSAPMPPPIRSMPPFGGDIGVPQIPLPPNYASSRRETLPRPIQTGTYRTPQLDPVLKPGVAAVGLVGLALLGGAALVVFGGLL